MAENKMVPRNMARIVTEIGDSIDKTQRRRGVAPPDEPRLREKERGVCMGMSLKYYVDGYQLLI